MQFAPSPCHWLITDNIIKPLMFTDGILLEDYTGSGALEAVVSHNEIILDTFFGGMWTNGLQDAFIYRNFISGTGSYGMGCVFTDDCLILSNRVSNYASNGMYFYQSNQNLIMGNYIRNNGGWGLILEESNYNCIMINMFYNNALGNVYDDGYNKYIWNFGL